MAATIAAVMRALLDGRPLAGATGRRGVGRYVRGLVEGLAALGEPDLEISLLVDAAATAVASSPSAPDGVAVRAVRAMRGPRSLWGVVLGPRWLRGADVWHATFLAPPRTPRALPWVATIHDLIPLRHPSSFTPAQRLVFRWSLARSARATRVVCVSRFTADLVARTFGVDAARLRVAPPPIDVASFAAPARRGLEGIDAPYLLHLGGFDPLKGVDDLLLPAFAELAARRPALRLALTGPDGAAKERARRAAAALGLAGRAAFVGALDDEAHRAAVAGAAAVVVSSREEGFGMPVAEALAAGVPVAVGPAAASREAAGTCGALAADGSPAALAAAIDDALRAGGADSPDGDARRLAARRFDQRAVARTILAIYREAAS